MRTLKLAILYRLILLLSLIVIFLYMIIIPTPKPKNTDCLNLKPEQTNDSIFFINNSWITKNKQGLYEMYIEGNSSFEMGVINGKLSKKLIDKQEEIFVSQIDKYIPSKFYQHFLKYFIGWFNKDIYKQIPKPLLLEIYGESLSFSDKYNYIAPKYQRVLNFHGAHDIGHALQNMNLVACTGFSAWNNMSADSSIIVGRNFDFYINDAFAQDKIVCFYKPPTGYNFVFITWGGFIGCVSGMNSAGLTVTINAAKSKIPYSSATPVSIIAREILQNAKNINEAYKIAQKYKSFVNESFLISSVNDNKTVVIEKSPDTLDIYKTNNNYIVVANHFQSNTFKNTKLTKDNIRENASFYRELRVKELIKKYKKLTPQNVAKILRDKNGLHNKNIGLGNEKAINQLIAHHSVIFKPKQQIIWVSSNPYQLGEYIAYDLNKIFNEHKNPKNAKIIAEKKLNIAADEFKNSPNFKKFKLFRKTYLFFKDVISKKLNVNINESFINNFIKLNPEYYLTYSIVGDIYKYKHKYKKAEKNYKIALTKEIAREIEIKHITLSLEDIKKLKK